MCIALPPPKPETSTRTPWTHKVTWWASGTGLHWVFFLCFDLTVQLWWFIVVIFMFKNLGLVILVRYSKENNYNYK